MSAGWFDKELLPECWFDSELLPEGWFDETLVAFSTGGDGDVNVGVSGQAFSITLGALSSGASIVSTGQAYTHVHGGVSASVTTGNVTAVVVGHTFAYNQGAIPAPRAIGLTGQSFAHAQGTTVAARSVAQVGQAQTYAQGSLGQARSVQATGQVFTHVQGAVSAGVSTPVTVALTGQSQAYAQGALGRAAAIVVAGQTYPVAQGSFSLGASKALAGQSLSLAQGSVSVSISKTVALAGQALTHATGTLGKTLAPGLVGQTLGFLFGEFTVSGGVAPNYSNTCRVVSLGEGVFIVTAMRPATVRTAAQKTQVVTPIEQSITVSDSHEAVVAHYKDQALFVSSSRASNHR